MNEDEDFQIEDVLSNLNKNKKRKKSKKKGNRGENNLCKVLIARFNLPFSRTVGSGARWSQANLTEEAKQVLTGDITTPANFLFCIESKHGYPEIDFCNAIEGGHRLINEFMEQAEKDAGRVNRMPLICWKKDRQPWVVFIKQKNFPKHTLLPFKICYNDWIVIALSELLKEPDNFFFSGE